MAGRFPPSPLLLALTHLLLLLLPLVATDSGNQLRYDGHRVYRVRPQTQEHLSKMEEYLQNTPEADVWQQTSGLAEPADIRVPPHHVTSFQNHFRLHDIPHETFIEDVQEKIERSRRSVQQTEDVFSRYHNYTEIMNWLDLKIQSCQSECKLYTIGQSTEGRDLKVLKISGQDTYGKEKQRIWIDAGIHAREWISPATSMYIIDRLISDYGVDPNVTTLVDTYDWYILPIINPDGYQYTWTDDRLWRKTRSLDNATGCYGVDANRNFDYKWMNNLRAISPCSNTYAGPNPFSEPEAAAVANAVKLLQEEGHVLLYLTLHSYSQLWMAPWGWTKHLPRGIFDLMEKGKVAVDALFEVHETSYRLGPASSILYESSGTSRDWAYGNNIPYVYTVELRDTGKHGFLLPPDQILPCGEEVWAALEAMVFAIKADSDRESSGSSVET